MKIGWVIPTVGTFGAVREMIEVSNVLIKRKHKVTIYHPSGLPCVWLESLAKTAPLDQLDHDELDVIIGIVDWQPELYAMIEASKAKIKAICLLGFTPKETMAQALRGEIPPNDKAEKIIHKAIQSGYIILADSSWQLDWVKENIPEAQVGVPFGGVNLAMFYPPRGNIVRPVKRVIASGDPRERKGTDVVLAAMDILKKYSSIPIEFDTYWGKKLNQYQLVEFYQEGDVFLDAHRRAGWCNPVAEAMACGVPSVCTDIGAVRDFAIHDQTALIVPVDDPERMAMSAMNILTNETLRNSLIKLGLNKIKGFSYNIVVPKLEKFLQEKLNE